MMNHLLKIKTQIFTAIIAFASINQANAQCLSINCPSNLTVSVPSGSCSAVVNYSAPIVSSTCGLVTQTLNYTGSMQTWTVPTGITTVTIQVLGAEGGNNTSSSVVSGRGADIKGVFTVTPSQVFNVLVGQFPGTSSNGGGGGTFVTDLSNNPIIIAGGGGGSSGGVDSPNKHGQAGTSGGTAPSSGGVGGTAGNGGAIGATFASGAGGGLLTDGAAGWTPTSGGKSFLTGGAGGTGGAVGGYGGGGSGSGYIVGAGGGGYSGGGGGSNSSSAGGVGGGGGSFNSGTNQVNTSGVNVGNGVAYFTYSGGTYTTTLVSGLASGSTFSLGTTVQTYSVADSFSNTTTCSFSVTVIDTIKPTVTCPSNLSQCATTAFSIAPMGVSDNCGSPVVTYSLSGATTGSGSNDASGTTFNTGITNVTYIATDASSNSYSCTFSVNINVTPTVTAMSSASLICAGQSATLTASGATTYTWSTSSNNTSIVVSPSVTTSYTVSGDSTGCVNSTVITQSVSACTGFEAYVSADHNCSVYPNPSNGEFTIKLGNMNEKMTIEIYNILGELIQTEKISSETTNVKLNAKTGTYLIKVTENNQLIYRTNIIKQ